MSESCRRLIVLLNIFFIGEAWIRAWWKILLWDLLQKLIFFVMGKPCPRQGTFPSLRFSRGRCLPTHKSSGSRGRKDSWDEKVGDSNLLKIECNREDDLLNQRTTMMTTWRLDSCTPPNADQEGERQQPGLNSTATCPFLDFVAVISVKYFQFVTKYKFANLHPVITHLFDK